MKQILLNNNEQNIIIHLESNTVLAGTYVNAEYQQPYDYKIKQLEKIADMVNTVVGGASIIEKQPSLSEASTVRKTSTNITLSITDTGVTYDFNYKKTQTNIVTFDEVINHFTEGGDKIFITGFTNSKFNIIDKYFPKNEVLKTINTIRPINTQPITNYATNNKIENKISVSIESLINGEQKINLSRVADQGNKTILNTNLDITNSIKSTISRFVGNPTDNQPMALEENLIDNKLVRINVKFNIPSLNMSVMILKDDPINNLSEYVLYLDTPNPIKYLDLGDGRSIFTYLRSDDIPNTTANMVLFDGYSEEPKIISEVFIDRGVNNPFERVKKLKNTKNLNELTKNGLGFYKINTKGYNFKNL
jgi:hypothetical protein